nr:MAG TPA: hypothetical protein [Caudoviricetes sp.]
MAHTERCALRLLRNGRSCEQARHTYHLRRELGRDRARRE